MTSPYLPAFNYGDTPETQPLTATPAAVQDSLAPEQPQKKPVEKPWGVGDYLLDAGKGAVNGAAGFVESLYNIPAAIVGADEADWKPFETQSFVGGLASGVTQFAIGMVAGGGLLKLAGWAVKGGEALTAGAKALNFARHLAQGGIADFISFGEHEQRLSNLIERYPALKNPVTGFLAAKPDDTWAEGRFKNVLEGMGVGQVADAFLNSLKVFKRATTAAKAGGEDAAQKALFEAAPGLEADLERLKAADEAAPVAPEAAAAPAPAVVAPTDAAESLAVPGAEVIGGASPIKADELNRFALNAKKIVEEGGTPDMAAKGADFAFRFATSDKDVLGIINSIHDAVRPLVEAAGSGPVRPVQATKDLADALGLAAGDAAGVLNQFSKVAANSHDLDVWVQAAKTAGTAVASELSTLSKKIFTQGGSREDYAQFLKLAQLNGRSLIDFMGVRANIGRSLRNLAEGANAPLTKTLFKDVPQGALEKMVKDSGGSDGLATVIGAIAQTGGEAGQVFRLLKRDSTGKFWALNNEWRINAMLWSAKTHVTNMVSGLVQTFILNPVERVVGSVIQGDWKTAKEALGVYGGFGQAVADANRAAVLALKGGNIIDAGHSLMEGPRHSITAKTFGAQDVPVLGKLIDWLGVGVRAPGQALGAADEWLKQLNYRAWMNTKATQEGIDKGLEGNALASFVSDRITGSFDALGRGTDQSAMTAARNATFTNDIGDSFYGKFLKDNVSKYPFMRFLFPFTKAPTNMIQWTVGHTPVVNLFQQRFRNAIQSADPMIRAQAYGQLATGTLMTLGIAQLISSGNLTGSGPQDPKLRQLRQASGWQPNSLVWEAEDGTKNYVNYNRAEPFGMLMGVMSDVSEAVGEMNDSESQSAAGSILSSILKSLASKTYLQGAADFMAALDGDPQTMARYLRQSAASYVPNVGSTLNGYIDPDLREVQSMADAIKAKIPGLSSTLPPRRNVFGEPIPAPTSGTWVDSLRGFNPYAYSASLPDAVKQKMADLGHAFAPPSPNQDGVDLRQFSGKGGQQAYDRFQELMSQQTMDLGNGRNATLKDVVGRTMGTDYFKGLDSVGTQDARDEQARLLQRNFTVFRIKAFHQLLDEIPELKSAYIARRQERANTKMQGVMSALAQQ